MGKAGRCQALAPLSRMKSTKALNAGVITPALSHNSACLTFQAKKDARERFRHRSAQAARPTRDEDGLAFQ
jgi:hypothetical protein